MNVTLLNCEPGISLRNAPLSDSIASLWLGVTRTSGSNERGSISLVPETWIYKFWAILRQSGVLIRKKGPIFSQSGALGCPY